MVVTTSQEPPGSPRSERCFPPSVPPACTLHVSQPLLHHQVPQELPPPAPWPTAAPRGPRSPVSFLLVLMASEHQMVHCLAHAARLVVWSGRPPRGTEARCAPALGLRFCLRSTDSCSSSLLSFPPARMARCTASMLGSTGTSAASSTTTASPTWCLCVCSCHTRICGFPGLPSSAPA